MEVWSHGAIILMEAIQLDSGVVSIYSNSYAFAAIKTTKTASSLSESYYTKFERYKILSNKETNFKYNADSSPVSRLKSKNKPNYIIK